MSTPKLYHAPCPYCEFLIPMAPAVRLWQVVNCPRCFTELEVISLDPPEMDYHGQEDWDANYVFEDDGFYAVEGSDLELSDWGSDDPGDQTDRDKD